MKYNFKNDYSEGAHPNIINTLSKTNYVQQEGYGDDEYCLSAAKLIKKELNSNDANIYFVSGGTQANLLCISAFLKPYESVIAAKTAHIEIHEAGAIEFTGHKINTIETKNGKLNPIEIQKVVDFHYDEHMVVPKLVFISNSTELGTIYKKAELKAISKVCKKNNLYLYIDGARLGSALSSTKTDINIKEISKFADAFYIGGTKNGALIGEAIVINNINLKEKFRYSMKQKGALIAKSRIIGIQFQELFTNDLFYKLATHANSMATKLSKGITNAGYEFFQEQESNQIFPIFPNTLISKLEKDFGFYIWTSYDNNKSIIRLVCSWATKEEAINAFIKAISN